jgi:serine/threonine-protein kinase
LGIIGSGGGGTVYKIEHLVSRRVEAMKVLPIGLSSDPEQIQRFEREIQVQARLHHPNIAALYTAVRDASTIALIMEFVEGESLQRMLEDGALPVSTAVEFAGQVLAALAYAHSEGVIHRDVAPANIIITHDRIAKLTDFGLARGLDDLRVTNNGAPLGSPWYMSPEQVRNVTEVDPRTDIYSLGAVLYQMVTGAKPFEADNAFSVMRAHVESAPAPPSTLNPSVSRELDATILKALTKQPSERFQSATEFRQALGFPQSLPIPAATSAAVPTPSAEPTVQLPPRSQRSARPRWFIPLVAAPGVLVAAIGGIAILRNTHRPSAAARPPVVAPVQPPQPVAVTPTPEPEPAVAAVPESSTPSQRGALPPTRRVSGARSRAPMSPIRVTGGEVESAATTTTTAHPRITGAAEPNGAPSALVTTLPDPPAIQPESGVPQAPAEPPVASSGPPAPQKPGNRFVRALGKINPFKKKNPDNQ